MIDRLPAFAFVFVVALQAAGCGPAGSGLATLSAASPPTDPQLYAAESAYEGYMHSVAQYRGLGLCPVAGVKPIVCADRALVGKLALAGKKAKTTLVAVENFAAAHPGQLGPIGLVQAAVDAITTAQMLLAQVPAT